MSKRLVLPLFAAGAALALLVASLSVANTPDVEAQEEAAIALTAQIIENAWNSHDVVTFRSYFTEEGFEAEFGFSKSDLQELAAIIGDPPVEATLDDIVVTGDTATATVTLSFAGGAFSEVEQWTFTFDGTRWLVSDSVGVAPEIPEGVNVVDVQLDEYEFIYDETAAAAGGDIAFTIENVGAEAHELVLFRITTDVPLEEILQSEEEEPEGIEFLGAGEADPGESSAVILQAPLEDGRYGMVCFFPAPDGTPHAFLGMVSEFNVGDATDGGAAPISPPSTGSAGLLDTSSSLSQQLLALSAILSLVALVSLVPVIRR